MTAGRQTQSLANPEDMPRGRLQPLRGRFYLMELRGVEPPVGPGPDPVRQHQASPENAKSPMDRRGKLFDSLAFFIATI